MGGSQTRLKCRDEASMEMNDMQQTKKRKEDKQ